MVKIRSVGAPLGEEISLKDDTKIVGHMSAVTADKIELDTSYGEVQLKRRAIVTISFPENGGVSKNIPVGDPGGPSGSLESYREVTMLNARRNLTNFEELAHSQATIDGK
jgi:hypothetical protein